MAQFQAYRNTRPSRAELPYLLDVQSDLVQTGTRLVVPLVRKERYGRLYTRLNLELTVEGVAVVAAVSDMAAIDARELREAVADCSSQRADILSAIDFLISGY